MKKIFAFLFALMLLTAFSACEQDLPTYSDPQARLNFDYTQYASGVVNYSFVFSKGKTKDTVWIQLNTMGKLSNEDRPFELQQITSGNHDAIPGKHYIGFDDASMKPYLTVPAGKNYARVPIVLLKDETLDTATFILNVALKPDANFQVGYFTQASMQITITNELSRPSVWRDFGSLMWYWFGNWGKVKHQFMIDHTGKNWDDAYINSISNNQDLMRYYQNKLQKELDALNKQRAAQGLDPLKEADGTLVDFAGGF